MLLDPNSVGQLRPAICIEQVQPRDRIPLPRITHIQSGQFFPVAAHPLETGSVQFYISVGSGQYVRSLPGPRLGAFDTNCLQSLGRQIRMCEPHSTSFILKLAPEGERADAN